MARISRQTWFTRRILGKSCAKLILETRDDNVYTPWLTLFSGWTIWRSSPESGPESSIELRIASTCRLPYKRMVEQTVAFQLEGFRYEVTAAMPPVFTPHEWHLRGFRVNKL